MLRPRRRARRINPWPVLLTAILLLSSREAIMRAMAATAAGSANFSPQSKSRDLDEAKRLNEQAISLQSVGKYDEALTLAQRALAIREKALGPEHPDVARSLNTLAELYDDKGDYPKAESLYQRALAIRQKALPPWHPSVTASLNNLASLYVEKGDYEKAEPLFQRAIAIDERTLGPDHRDVATDIHNLAVLYARKGDPERAEPLYQRALAIREKALGSGHPLVAVTLDSIAQLHLAKDDFAKAESFFQRALAIREKALGQGDPNVAHSLNSLASLYDRKGDYAKAELLFQRAIAIDEALDPRHPRLSAHLNNLASLYNRKGDYARAEPLFQRAIAIDEALDPQHPRIAATLNNLALLYKTKGDYAKAEPLYQRVLAILEKAFGPEHPNVATSLSNLAALYKAKGDYAKAEPLLQRALATHEKVLSPEHTLVAADLHNLGQLLQAKGEYAKAEPLFQRALAIHEKALGPEHPNVAISLNDLAIFYESKGNITQAVAFKLRANQVFERNIALNLAIGSEKQKLLYLATLSGEIHRTISLHVQSAPADPAARNLALLTILQRKGRALDAITDSVGALRRRLNPQDRSLLDELTETRSRLATLVLRGPGKNNPAQHQAEIKRLEDQLEKIEDKVGRLSAEFRTLSQPVTLEAVQAAIPPGAALVEFVLYRPFNAREDKWGARRYVAYVLGSQGDIKWTDLGEASLIDNAVDKLRAVLRKEEGKPLSDMERLVKPRARTLDHMVMEPIRKLLGNTRRLLIAPDGALNLAPFQAMVGENNRYLVESLSISYLTSGRDLLRLKEKRQSKRSAMIVADPAFGGDMSECKNRGALASRAAVNFSQVFFCPLPGTNQEAEAIKQIMPDATVLTKEQATESVIKQVAAPSILHIATHGFFLENVVIGSSGDERGVSLMTKQADSPQMRVENPLLRSGLAMSGANLRKSGDDDGVLTALEVASLNLWGTKLLVLSACETGLGEVRNGDGVYGLRRALVLAGSESQVMSLWRVDDEATRDLMIDYYKRLQAGEGRSEALRQVQLKMLASKNRQHPFFWAGFIESGEWANLDGKR